MSSEGETSQPHCNLYDGANGYRLGDVSGSRFFRHTAGGMNFHLKTYPDSLAAKFLRQYTFGTRAYRGYYNSSCDAGCNKHGYCQCYVPRAHALHEILEHERAAEPAGTHAPPLARTAAVHLRIGDVVDQSPHSIDEMLSSPTRFQTRCSVAQLKLGCLSIHPVVYVQPISRYEPVCQRLHELHIERVVVVAASSVNQSAFGFSHDKSCEYVKRMGAFLRARGFDVTYRLGQRPDDDFRFLTRVACLVPTLSGFSGLAGQVAQKFGVRIAMPEGLTLPTADLTG